MQELAAIRGGKCLSKKYNGHHSPHSWQCAQGHVWKAPASRIKNGNWCGKCAGNVPGSIEEMRAIASTHGGACLSKDYINANTRLRWCCGNGHEWKATPGNIKAGSWCGICAGVVKKTINDMHNLAGARDGKCLSTKYVKVSEKLRWQCKEGHEWEASASKIQLGRWCPHCAGNMRGSLSDLQKLAKKKGGSCLSKTYLSSSKPHLWQCAEGHKWKAAPSNIRQGHWCPECFGNSPKTIEDMRVVAESKGGQFLSPTYTNNSTKYLWRCQAGHEWRQNYANIQQGTWCPQCQDHSSERICRAHFESIFGEKFPSKKPAWLVNDRGNRMELDGHAEKLALAFEYQGVQHYRQHDHWHRSSMDAARRQTDDQRKASLCRQRGVTLIAVPYMIPLHELQEFIVKECLQAGIAVPKGTEKAKIDLSTAYSARWMEELREIARKRGGECLSDNYVSAHTKMSWRCAEGHEWDATATMIKHGSNWCPRCAHKARRKTIEDAKVLANLRGGSCLSKTYINSNSKLLWECSHKHQWEATFKKIREGRWCPTCARASKLTIGDMRKLAKARNGKCLSDYCENRKSVLLWECAEGHRWESRAANIHAGSWCPKCADRVRYKRLTIEDMREAARLKGGRCLSEKYENVNTRLLWQCSDGHKWKSRAINVRAGKWCPECWNQRRSKRSK